MSRSWLIIGQFCYFCQQMPVFSRQAFYLFALFKNNLLYLLGIIIQKGHSGFQMGKPFIVKAHVISIVNYPEMTISVQVSVHINSCFLPFSLA